MCLCVKGPCKFRGLLIILIWSNGEKIHGLRCGFLGKKISFSLRDLRPSRIGKGFILYGRSWLVAVLSSVLRANRLCCSFQSILKGRGFLNFFRQMKGLQKPRFPPLSLAHGPGSALLPVLSVGKSNIQVAQLFTN